MESRARTRETATGLEQELQRAIAETRDLLQKLEGVELRHFEEQEAAAAVQKMLASGSGPLEKILVGLRGAADLLSGLPGGSSPAEESEEQSVAELGLDDAFAESDEDLSANAASWKSYLDEVDGQLTSLSTTRRDAEASEKELRETFGMLSAQVRRLRAQISIVAARRSKWGLITEGEEALRRTRKALRLALAALERFAGHQAAAAGATDPRELEESLAVRRALMAFRSTVLCRLGGLEDADDVEVVACAEAARGDLLELRRQEIFTALRAPDRYQLRAFVARLGTSRTAVEIREVLMDLRTFADMLTEVNNREVLVEHDHSVARACLETLNSIEAISVLSPAQAESHLNAVLVDLRALEGRDGGLDALAAESSGVGSGSSDDLGPIVLRLVGKLQAIIGL